MTTTLSLDDLKNGDSLILGGITFTFTRAYRDGPLIVSFPLKQSSPVVYLLTAADHARDGDSLTLTFDHPAELECLLRASRRGPTLTCPGCGMTNHLRVRHKKSVLLVYEGNPGVDGRVMLEDAVEDWHTIDGTEFHDAVCAVCMTDMTTIFGEYEARYGSEFVDRKEYS